MASHSEGEISIISPKFKWVINKFCIGCKNVGDEIMSPRFVTIIDNKKIEWYMSLYPKGHYANKNYLSLYVTALTKILAEVTLEIIDSKGGVAFFRTVTGRITEKGLGYTGFVKQKFIIDPANDILNDDRLTIVCTIALPDNKQMREYKKLISEEERKLAAQEKALVSHRLAEMDKYEALLNDDSFSDILFISEGKKIECHKCILAKSSPVFAAMFNTDMKEKQTNTVEISDIKYNVLVEMIRFIYSGKVNNVDMLAPELAEAADKYALDALKNICEIIMCQNLNCHNVLLYTKLADRCGLNKLKEEGLEYIVLYADKIVNQEEFQFLPANCMNEICRAMAKELCN